MLQLLSPAGTTETVIAAVQSGADMIYMGYGATAADTLRNEAGLSSEELAQCLRYCRVRGCRAAVTLNELVTDDTMDKAVERAIYAAEQGASALLVQDVGLIAVLRRVLPEMPLWGGVRLCVHSTDGALAAAAMGLSRVMLSPELTLEQIQDICKNAPIETAVCVHGPACFAYSGQCYMSAMADRRFSDSCVRCSEPCRERFSLGGRLDDYPMSMADYCLIEHLPKLDEAGVTCAVIGGRSRRPEYVAYITTLYAHAVREGVMPTQEEYDQLRELFAPNGMTDGYLTGEKGSAMFGVRKKSDRVQERAMAAIRKEYMDSEMRRVPVTFYVVIQQGKNAMFAAEDEKGHRAVYQGYVPIDLGRQGISSDRVKDILYRTGGTPFYCTGIQCLIDPNMDYPDEGIEQARHALLQQITEQNRNPEPVRAEAMPEAPDSSWAPEKTKLIFQITREEQMTEELSEAKPDYLYVPAEILAAGSTAVDMFREKGTQIVAVLPRIVSDAEKPVLRELLATLKTMNVREVLAGSMGLIPSILEAGMLFRGDYGLNLSNRWAMQWLTQAGFGSVTASFQLSARQIETLAKQTPVEMIIYGRVPVMVTEHCLIRNSTGRCSCSTPTNMSDRFGNVYPVEKEFGCRNVVFDGKKIFLADRPEVYDNIGLWAARLMFTTESARECVDVAYRYRGQNGYRPNNTTRGLYPKGAL